MNPARMLTSGRCLESTSWIISVFLLIPSAPEKESPDEEEE